MRAGVQADPRQRVDVEEGGEGQHGGGLVELVAHEALVPDGRAGGRDVPDAERRTVRGDEPGQPHQVGLHALQHETAELAGVELDVGRGGVGRPRSHPQAGPAGLLDAQPQPGDPVREQRGLPQRHEHEVGGVDPGHGVPRVRPPAGRGPRGGDLPRQ